MHAIDEFVYATFIMLNLLRNAKLKPITLRELQNRRLRKIIEHSYEQVPYYHSLMKKAGVSPSDIKSLDDLCRIPITDRNDLRDLPLNEIIAKNADPRRYRIRRTSGTTGVVVSVAWDLKAVITNILTHIRWMRSCGNKISNKIVQIGDRLPTNTLIQRAGINKVKSVAPSDSLIEQLKEIRKFKPDVFLSFPSSFRLLAAEIRERGIRDINPNLVFTGGEILDAYTRRLSEEVFGAEVFDHYGSNEAGDIACECYTHSGYHVLSDLLHVEIIRDDEVMSKGEEGEITVTNFFNFATPIIRYNLEDIGFLLEEDCSCGQSFPLMMITQGRKGEIIELPDGRAIPVVPIQASLYPVQGVKEIQLIQEKKDLFLVKIMKSSDFTTETIEEIKQKLREMVGDVRIEVLIFDTIQKEKSGKFKHFISNISTPASL